MTLLSASPSLIFCGSSSVTSKTSSCCVSLCYLFGSGGFFAVSLSVGAVGDTLCNLWRTARIPFAITLNYRTICCLTENKSNFRYDITSILKEMFVPLHAWSKCQGWATFRNFGAVALILVMTV